jgi:dTMP kinase
LPRGRTKHGTPEDGRQGVLIALEGPEGAGKTTQHRRLADWLGQRRVPFLGLHEPGGTALGQEIRRLLLDSDHEIGDRAEALLFMASRAELVEREIQPALKTGQVVVLDRFFLSTYAYQVAGRGLDEMQVRHANRLATGGLVPDLTVLLRVPAEVGMARVTARRDADRIERSSNGFHERVVQAFDLFLDAKWQREHPECGPIVAVDGRGTPDEVFTRVASILATRWPETFGALGES